MLFKGVNSLFCHTTCCFGVVVFKTFGDSDVFVFIKFFELNTKVTLSAVGYFFEVVELTRLNSNQYRHNHQTNGDGE